MFLQPILLKKVSKIFYSQFHWKKQSKFFYSQFYWKKFRKFLIVNFRLLKNFLLLNSLKKKIQKFFTVNFIEKKFRKFLIVNFRLLKKFFRAKRGRAREQRRAEGPELRPGCKALGHWDGKLEPQLGTILLKIFQFLWTKSFKKKWKVTLSK